MHASILIILYTLSVYNYSLYKNWFVYKLYIIIYIPIKNLYKDYYPNTMTNCFHWCHWGLQDIHTDLSQKAEKRSGERIEIEIKETFRRSFIRTSAKRNLLSHNRPAPRRVPERPWASTHQKRSTPSFHFFWPCDLDDNLSSWGSAF